MESAAFAILYRHSENESPQRLYQQGSLTCACSADDNDQGHHHNNEGYEQVDNPANCKVKGTRCVACWHGSRERGDVGALPGCHDDPPAASRHNEGPLHAGWRFSGVSLCAHNISQCKYRRCVECTASRPTNRYYSGRSPHFPTILLRRRPVCIQCVIGHRGAHPEADVIMVGPVSFTLLMVQCRSTGKSSPVRPEELHANTS